MDKFKSFLVNCWVRMCSNKEKLFTKYYINNSWRNNESRSGIGSSLEHTERLRAQLPSFLQEYNVRTIFDAPCGDFNWFRHIQRDGINYIGADIVRPLVADNNAKHEDATTKFIHLDVTRDRFPSADLWLCRDLFFHLSEEDIFRALNIFLESDIPWILTTTFPDHLVNHDIPTGSFRLINLEITPYNFPTPVCCLVDSIPSWQKRLLALWDKKAVSNVVMATRSRS